MTSRAFDLKEDVAKKLHQAAGICDVICSMSDIANTPITASLWAASELIQEAKKGVHELYEQKGVQS